MATTANRKPASFRLRADLLENLKRNAARENRTLNNYVESVLLEVVYREPNDVTKAAIAGFQLFAISKSRFHSDYTEEGKDITVLVGNPDFTGNSWVLWTVTGTWGNQRFNGAAEVWHSTNFSMQQTLKGLPKGDYTVSCQMVNGEGSNTGYLFATAGGETKQDVVKQSCAGSNFDAERDKMASNADYGKLSVRVTVGDDGLLTFGLKEPSTGNTWLVWDNFRLRYEGDYTGVGEVKSEEVKSEESDNVYYDLMGRRIAKPERGFYIHGGKKYVK